MHWPAPSSTIWSTPARRNKHGVYDLEEQEQIDTLKTWWKMYGNLVTSLLTVAALAVLEWQAWNWYQNKQAVEAAGVFAHWSRPSRPVMHSGSRRQPVS